MLNNEKPKLVIDNCILIEAEEDEQAIEAKRPFQMVEKGEADMLVSIPLWYQYKQALCHPEFYRKTNKDVDYTEDRLDWIADKAIAVERVPHQVEMQRNRKDQFLINLAVYKEADFIITRDPGVLKLDNHPDWKAWFPAIRVVEPEQLQHELTIWWENKIRLEQGRQMELKHSRGISY